MAAIDIHSAEWHETRRRSIGASEAAAVLNASPFKSALELWAEKRGLLSPEFDEETLERLMIGTLMEPVIGGLYTARTGAVLQHCGQGDPVYHPRFPEVPLSCTPDFIVLIDDGLVEAKNVSAWMAQAWRDEPPLGYQVQAQAQLACCPGRPYVDAAGLIGGSKLVVHRVERDAAFISELERTVADWWTRYVVAGVEPPPEANELSLRAFQRLHPDDSGDEIQLDDEFGALDERLSGVKSEQKALESERSELENRIKAALGTATFGVLPGGGRFSWKTQVAHIKATEACERKSRVLRRSK